MAEKPNNGKGHLEVVWVTIYREQYFEIYNTAQLPSSKPQMMKYLSMTMVWAEIVLHKDVD
jgi:hypothetical protein